MSRKSRTASYLALRRIWHDTGTDAHADVTLYRTDKRGGAENPDGTKSNQPNGPGRLGSVPRQVFKTARGGCQRRHADCPPGSGAERVLRAAAVGRRSHQPGV